MSNRTPEPEYIAAKIIADLGLDVTKPIDLLFVAKSLNIRVVRRKIGTGILGACKAEGSHRLIVISPDIKNSGRERFTFAHEIGHILMHHGIHCCRTEDFYWQRKSSPEQLANRFAAALLIPQKAVQPIAQKKDITIKLTEELSDRYEVSTVAMAIRLADWASEPTVLLYFESGKYKWMTYTKGRFVEIRAALHVDELPSHDDYKQRDASLYFSNVKEETLCWSQMKRYVLGNGYDFSLCLVTFEEYAENEYD
jgi:Zn-dependent peptidase ImmA (M78 family)